MILWLQNLLYMEEQRDEAISRMERALGEFIIDGVTTNIGFQLEILNNPKFLSGDFDTSFISSELGYNS